MSQPVSHSVPALPRAPSPLPTVGDLENLGGKAVTRQRQPGFQRWLDSLRAYKRAGWDKGGFTRISDAADAEGQNARDLWKFVTFALQTGLFHVEWRDPNRPVAFADPPSHIGLQAMGRPHDQNVLSSIGMARHLWKFLWDNKLVTPSEYTHPTTGSVLYQLDTRLFLDYDWSLTFPDPPPEKPRARKLGISGETEAAKKAVTARGQHARISTLLPGAVIHPVYLEMLAATQPDLMQRPTAEIDRDEKGRLQVSVNRLEAHGAEVIKVTDWLKLRGRALKPGDPGTDPC